MERWVIKPQNSPDVCRRCIKCKEDRKFICSNNFRINANGKNIDIWLIYRCEKCDATWNMEILSRINPKDINHKLYESFVINDKNLAIKYSFSPDIIKKNKVIVSFDNIRYKVEKFSLPDSDYSLEIILNYDFELRLDKFISKQFHISRTEAKHIIETTFTDENNSNIPANKKIKGIIKIKKISLKNEYFKV